MRTLTTPFLVLIFVAVLGSTSDAATQSWQLTFTYDQNAVTVLRAGRVADQAKAVATPGLTGAPVRISYDVDWLDASGQTLTSTLTEIPLGIRSAPADSGPCIQYIPESGAFVVRLTGPSVAQVPASLRLTKANVTHQASPQLSIPAPFLSGTLTLPIRSITPSAAPAQGPVSSAKIWSTGPDRNRLVIVIMGDGYTSADLAAGSFRQHAANLVSAFQGKSPWDITFNATNVYRVDIESNQKGADHDPYGTYVDTYLNSSFYVSGIARLLAIDGTGYTRATAAADAFVGVGVWDQIFVLVNSTTYGGSGGGISVSSVHPSASEIILHEFGHTFAGLADEYSDAYPGYPAGDPEPNVDYDYSGSGLKWLDWVEPGTPLPTPNTTQYSNVVGAFEGARYLTTGIYRPWRNCLMRSLGVAFDPVCKEAHMLRFMSIVSLADTAIPTAGWSSLVPITGISFQVTGLPIDGLTYQWSLNSAPISGAIGSSITLNAADMYHAGLPAWGTLSLKIGYPTTMVRGHDMSNTLTWTLLADCNGNGVRDDFDIQNGTSQDLNHNGIPDECDFALCCRGVTGNLDGDSNDVVDISDLTALVDYLFEYGSISSCPHENDVDTSGAVDIGDVSGLIDYLFFSAALPSCP